MFALQFFSGILLRYSIITATSYAQGHNRICDILRIRLTKTFGGRTQTSGVTVGRRPYIQDLLPKKSWDPRPRSFHVSKRVLSLGGQI